MNEKIKNKIVNGLEENKYYSFKILKTTIAPDNCEYYVLECPYGNKYLLNKSYYDNYGLKINREIICKIDRINCSGKIFLEPEHPNYIEGNSYKFEYIKTQEITNVIGEREPGIIVKDILGKEWTVPYKNDIQNKKNVELKIERIKKGKLFLNNSYTAKYKTSLKKDKSYNFKILSIIIINNIKYYALEDEFTGKHLLDFDYFTDYNYKEGDKIKCRVVKFSTKGRYILEPEHPKYNIGKIYNFPVIRIKQTKSDCFVIVEDCFKNEISIKVNDKIGKKLSCKVENIRKGKLVLEYILKRLLTIILIP
ncbi:MAG: hypothetical protein KAT68_00930 [Bacteroidales bacterium]|nr:hypothetical protein [Bacteroidales bacterium]